MLQCLIMYMSLVLWQNFLPCKKDQLIQREPSDWHCQKYTVELQWLEHLWDHGNKFETGVVRFSEVYSSARSGGIIGMSYQFSLT